MPIDWDAFDRDVDVALDRAQRRTDERLAQRVAAVTRLTEAEIMELFPEPADVERLKRLLLIVNSAEDRNRKIAALVSNIEDLAGVVVTLVSKAT